MKCTVCGETLSDYESTLRHAVSKQFLDTCKECLQAIGNVPVQARNDLLAEVDLDVVESLLDGDDDDFYDDKADGDDDYYDWDNR